MNANVTISFQVQSFANFNLRLGQSGQRTQAFWYTKSLLKKILLLYNTSSFNTTAFYCIVLTPPLSYLEPMNGTSVNREVDSLKWAAFLFVHPEFY